MTLVNILDAATAVCWVLYTLSMAHRAWLEIRWAPADDAVWDPFWDHLIIAVLWGGAALVGQRLGQHLAQRWP